MADKKISDLRESFSPLATDYLPVVNNNETKKVALDNLIAQSSYSLAKINNLISQNNLNSTDHIPIMTNGGAILKIPGSVFITSENLIPLTVLQNTSALFIIQNGNTLGQNLNIGSNDSYNLNIKTNNTTRIAISSTGFVGIGVLNPSNTLDVGGEVFIRGVGSNNKIFSTPGQLAIKGNADNKPTISFHSQDGTRLSHIETYNDITTLDNSLVVTGGLSASTLLGRVLTTSRIEASASDITIAANRLFVTGSLAATLTSNIVTTNSIQNSAVTNEKIAISAVTTSNIAASAITADKMSGGQTGEAPVYGCRAWFTFDCTRDIFVDINPDTTRRYIYSSGNIEYIEKIDTGLYRVVFLKPMPSFNYSVVTNSISGIDTYVESINNIALTSVDIGTFQNGSRTDAATYCTGSVFA